MKYCTLTNLIRRINGEEAVQLGWPELRITYLGEAPLVTDLAVMYAAAVVDDCALVVEDDSIYRFDGALWGSLAADRIDRAIDDAGGTIDGYLASRYKLPLGTVPTVLARIACDLARYNLYDDLPTEHVTKRNDDSMKFLKSVANGAVNLGVNDVGEGAVPNDAVEFQSGGNVFDRKDTSFI